ncbi:Vicilin-like seed storage protein, partial [Glycine soja]
NVEEAQKLHIICSIDPSESLGVDVFQSFYIEGGAHPASLLSGFESEILETAFNVRIRRRVAKNLHWATRGPNCVRGGSHATSIWTKFLQLKEEDKLYHLREIVQQEEGKEEEEFVDEEEQQTSWSWRKILESVFEDEIKNTREKVTKTSPLSCNLYDRKPDFKNCYGWSVDQDGSEMAPHVNPRAKEYGIGLKGSGRIQIVFPNGSNAIYMDAHIKEGDVFFIPRYFAFCQIASKNEPLEFFGFTTSAQKNRPQFLVGATSLMRTMVGPELAAAFGVSEETMRRMARAQHEAVILPTPWTAHAHDHKVVVDRVQKLTKNEMVMGF